MLEADEVDDDYFTPVANASLANIFGKPTMIDEKSENESLKYIPPKPQVNKQTDDTKATSCVFACALVGYEWLNNQYLQKGRLGFALIKVLKTGNHNIILYDSNKTTLSNTSVTSTLKVTLKNNNFLSYYDDQRKYWSLYSAANDVKTICDMLSALNVQINAPSETDTNPPEPVTNTEMKFIHEEEKKSMGSDTDSSVNRKTKASILNRMANMGHSVLPPSTITVEKTSDSSDTNDMDYHVKAVRHKPVKGIVKRSSFDRNIIDHQKLDVVGNVDNPKYSHISEIKNATMIVNDQLVPLNNTANIMTSYGNDMNIFVSEQRISNSELRINIGRMSDKMDDIVNKIDKLHLKEQNEGTSINTTILNKLLQEYEGKIKVYEELFQKMGTEKSLHGMIIPTLNHQPSQSSYKNEEELNSKVKELENNILEKDKCILKLRNEMETLRSEKEEQCNTLHKNIATLETELKTYKDKISQTDVKDSNNDDVSSKIKSVMNDTYQAVATNFEHEEKYTGESVKKTIAMVIKKVTICALNET